LGLWGVVSLYLMFNGGVEFARVRGYARAPAKPHESGIYDYGGVSYLSCARGFYVSCFTVCVWGGGYVVVCTVFYEWGFGMASH
jgi:hypothetical protein